MGLVGLLIFVLPVAAVATCLLAAGRRSWTGFAGVISGVGAPLLYVAYLHRQGPGYVCTASSVAQTCTQELSPWPWLVVGLVLVAAGVTVFLARRIPSRAPVP